MNHPTIKQIKERVSKFYGVSVMEIDQDRRLKYIVRARHVAYWLSCEMTLKSLPEIGRAIGNRDHTTIMHGRNSIREKMTADKDLANELDFLSEDLICMPPDIEEENRKLKKDIARIREERDKARAERDAARREKARMAIKKAVKARSKAFVRTMSHEEEERLAIQRYNRRGGAVVNMVGEMPPPGRSALDMKRAGEAT